MDDSGTAEYHNMFTIKRLHARPTIGYRTGRSLWRRRERKRTRRIGMVAKIDKTGRIPQVSHGEWSIRSRTASVRRQSCPILCPGKPPLEANNA